MFWLESVKRWRVCWIGEVLEDLARIKGAEARDGGAQGALRGRRVDERDSAGVLSHGEHALEQLSQLTEPRY